MKAEHGIRPEIHPRKDGVPIRQKGLPLQEDGGPLQEEEGWLRLRVEGIPPDRLHLLAEALRALGARGLVREGPRVTAFLPPEPRKPGWREKVLAEMRLRIHAATSIRDPLIQVENASIRELERRWRVTAPGRVSPRLTLAPTGTGEGGSPDAILLPPGPAFGDGSHPSTRLALRLLDRCFSPGESDRAASGGSRLLDLGTGSGVLAVAALRLGASHITALESDPPSVDHARETFRRNGVEALVDLRKLRAGPAYLRRLPLMDGVLANVEGPVLEPLLPSLLAVVKPGGWLLSAGLGREDDGWFEARLAAAGAQIHHRLQDGGWTAYWVQCPAP